MLGQWKFEVSLPDDSTFEDFLEELVRIGGSEFRPHLFEADGKTLLGHVMFMVNGRNINFLNRQHTILTDGDSVVILPPAGGG
jgi:sulfur-carrier protein